MKQIIAILLASIALTAQAETTVDFNASNCYSQSNTLITLPTVCPLSSPTHNVVGALSVVNSNVTLSITAADPVSNVQTTTSYTGVLGTPVNVVLSTTQIVSTFTIALTPTSALTIVVNRRRGAPPLRMWNNFWNATRLVIQ